MTTSPGTKTECKVAHFTVACHAMLDSNGEPRGALPAFADDPEEVRRLYRWMVMTRTFDAKAIALQRTGRLGTFASSLGQEAVGVALGAAMRPEDLLLPSFREHGAQLLRGVTLAELFSYWGGDERGNDFAGPREDFPVCVPVGSQAPHAAGVALAFALRGEARVAVAVFGDGATSKGDVYEAMNFAGLWRLPLLFVVNNNQWAISVPRKRQSAARTLAQKAIAAGFEGEQVDGNDVIALKARFDAALARARDGEGPQLIEALTYRMGDHTTADDARRYRDDAEVSDHWKEDPLVRLRHYMTGRDWWGKDEEAELLATCREEVEAAVEAYLARPPQAPESIFDSLYAQLPKDLESQRAELLAKGAGSSGGDDG